MSAALDKALAADHTPAEMASLDVHAVGRRVRVALPPIHLTDDQFAAVDDTAGLEPL